MTAEQEATEPGPLEREAVQPDGAAPEATVADATVLRAPVLQARGVTKRFAGIRALDRVDLCVEPGERVGLIGPNGAGKTTLFNCLRGVLRCDGGSVELDGEDVTRLPVHQRARRGIGRTFQRIELFPGSTVRDHLLVAERVRRGTGRLWKDLVGRGRPQPDEIERCDEVLELLGLSDVATEPIERLSLGKGRLVEVGRALMTQPKVLLLDEPSSGLDRAETAALAETLRQVQAEHGFAIGQPISR
jgi:branched-chain amino acid transport system ATP-binding protein